jgi:hypothetical protein
LISQKVVIEIEGGIVQKITYADINCSDMEYPEFYVKDLDNASVGEKAIYQLDGERVSFYEVDKIIDEKEELRDGSF